jgi:hypothetical protein
MHRSVGPIWKPVSLGVFLGLILINLGVMIGGGGHGWLVPFSIGMLGVIVCPLAGLAWTTRHTKGKWLATILLVIGIWTDYLFIQSLRNVAELQKAEQGAWVTITFLMLWASWQIWVIWTLMSKRSIKNA